jgi:hypothetical protein
MALGDGVVMEGGVLIEMPLARGGLQAIDKVSAIRALVALAR